MILVTGATGFIGSYVVRALLAHGRSVLAASRYPWRPEARRVIGGETPPLIHPELRDPAQIDEALRGREIEGIIHLDALVDPVALQNDPLRAFEFNVNPAINLLEACRSFGIEHFVLASSISVLPAVRAEPIRVDHPIVTNEGGSAGGFYGVAKAASEVIALGYRSGFGIDVRVIRPSAVYGFGMQWPIGIKPVVEGLVRREPVVMPGRAPRRDYTPVQDVAAIFCAALDCRPEDDVVFNAGTGEQLTTSDRLVAVMRTVFPDGDITVTDEDLDPTGVESTYRGVLDMAPVREQLGVQGSFASLEAGIAAYAEEYRRSWELDITGGSRAG